MDNKRPGELTALERYREYADFQFSIDGEGLGLREARDALGGSLSPAVAELDALVIESALVNDYINPALLQDDPAQPPEKWWWRLGAIRRREFPPEKLPPHLRPAYR